MRHQALDKLTRRIYANHHSDENKMALNGLIQGYKVLNYIPLLQSLFIIDSNSSTTLAGLLALVMDLPTTK